MQKLLTLKDGAILQITDSYSKTNGCPTCDFGADYYNDLDIELKKFKVNANFCSASDYPCSSKDLLNIFIPNLEKINQMTEKEFIQWFEDIVTAKWHCRYHIYTKK